MSPHPETRWNRPECPDVERWTVPAIGATEHEVTALIAAIVTALKPDVVVETGTFLGGTAAAIGYALRLLKQGRLWTLELDSARAMAAELLLASLPVTVVCTDSLFWTPEAPIDLLFADSTYATRAEEMRRFRAFASPRCVILTHDTVDPDYRAFIEPLVTEGIVFPWTYLPTPYGLGLTRFTEVNAV